MATIAEQLSSYATSLRYEDLPDHVVHQAKFLILDTLGCALGGYTSQPSAISREMAGTVTSTKPATVLGSGQATSLDLAVFANGVMIRYLDFNDGYTSKLSGHASDSIAATLSSTEVAGAGGQRLITSTVLAYEAFCRICDTVALKHYGFDHVTVGCIASIMGSAQALKLSEAHTLEALNIGIASCLALNVTRVGDLSMWKGCAYANASRNAIFAVSLAQRGMTGPSPVFEGTDGYFKVVSHGPFELEPFGGNGQPFKIMESNVKRFPLGQYSQTVVQAALEVRDQMPDPADIEEVNIKTLQTAVTIMAGDPEKWHPTNRETADHSMPYTAAVALMFGDIGLQQFEDEYLGNRQLQDLVGKVNVHAWEEANRREPEAMLCSLEVVTKSGQRYASEVPYHRGHWKNPMSDAEVEAKFRGQAEGLLSPANTDALLDHLWNLERAENLGEVFRLMRIDS